MSLVLIILVVLILVGGSGWRLVWLSRRLLRSWDVWWCWVGGDSVDRPLVVQRLERTVVSHGALVEINPGLWVCPTRVAVVVALNGVPSRHGPDVPPTVRVTVDGDPSIFFEFDTWDAAVAFAAKLAARINEAMRHYGP